MGESTNVPTVAELQEMLSHHSAFTRTYEFEVRDAADGHCTIAVPFLPQFVRPGAILSGPVMITAADVAMWLAIKTLRGIDDTSVTAQLDTTFMRPARAAFICHATVLDISERRAFGVSDCRSLAGELLSHHSLTYVRPG